jgi:hypothetical protein
MKSCRPPGCEYYGDEVDRRDVRVPRDLAEDGRERERAFVPEMEHPDRQLFFTRGSLAPRYSRFSTTRINVDDRAF